MTKMENLSIIEKFSLKGKVALVTGATGHLGREIINALASAGAHVIVNGRDSDKVKERAENLRHQGFETTELVVDITDYSRIKSELLPLLARFGRLDVLVNNAYGGKPTNGKDISVEDFAAAYDITVSGAFHLIEMSLPFLKASGLANEGGASIINIGSMYSIVSPNPEIYGASLQNNPPYYGPAKAALGQLTRYLACHLALDRIRVNTLMPGPFPNEMVQKAHPEFIKSLMQKVPMHRIGAAYEIQGPILFLASEASSYVTGSELRVDGGWTAW